MSCVACTVGAGIATGDGFPGSGDAFSRSTFVYSIVEDSESVKAVIANQVSELN